MYRVVHRFSRGRQSIGIDLLLRLIGTRDIVERDASPIFAHDARTWSGPITTRVM